MQELHSKSFFDLETFAHKDLLLKGSYVWNSLDFLSQYLETLSLGEHLGEISSQAFLVHPELIFIGEGSVVEPGAYIQGPCWIGAHCTVRHGAYVRGNVITGNHCVIGHTTEVKHSIFLNKAQASHFAYVGDSILGTGVNLGAGTKLANLKLSGKEIAVHTKKGRISTGRRKFGAILGDGVQTGCNSVTNPGTLLGKRASVYPCVNVGGIVAEGEVAR